MSRVVWNCGIWITKGTKAREKHESAFVFEQVVKVAWHGRVAALGGYVYLVRGRGYDLEPDGPEFRVVGRGWPAVGLGVGAVPYSCSQMLDLQIFCCILFIRSGMCDFERGVPHTGHINAVFPQAGLCQGSIPCKDPKLTR